MHIKSHFIACHLRHFPAIFSTIFITHNKPFWQHTNSLFLLLDGFGSAPPTTGEQLKIYMLYAIANFTQKSLTFSNETLCQFSISIYREKKGEQYEVGIFFFVIKIPPTEHMNGIREKENLE